MEFSSSGFIEKKARFFFVQICAYTLAGQPLSGLDSESRSH
jgi:hypothetical protein